MKTMGYSFIPVAVNKQAPAARANSVQFGASEEQVTRRLDELMAAVTGKKVKLVSANPSKYEMTLDIDGKKFVLSGFGAPRFGTMPEQYSLKSLDSGEVFRYTGHGCFSPPSVRYGDNASDLMYGEEAEKTLQTMIALKDAVGG